MEEIVKLIIPFLIFLFFIFRTVSQRKAKMQEEAELVDSSEVEVEEEEIEVNAEKEMTKRDLKRWFTEEQRKINRPQQQNSQGLTPDFPQKESSAAYQSVDSMMKKNNRMKKQVVEEASVSKVSPLIRLRSKEDAKRAFLYSEIFNRKY